MGKKAVVIVSGGVDSTTLLYKTLKDRIEPYVLTFFYGQRHRRELDSAENICNALAVPHRIIDLSDMNGLLSGSALTDATVDVPDVPETAEHFDTLKSTIVPNRNAIFLSVAVGYAVSLKADHVFFGAHFSDRGVYPDCRKEFVEAFQTSERLATDNPSLMVEAPFVDMEKSGIVKLGVELGVPFGETWTCYKGGALHCGLCSACRERKRAFHDAEVSDPTEYEA